MTIVSQKRSEFGSAGEVHRWAALASFAEALFAASTVEERADLVARQVGELTGAGHARVEVKREGKPALYAEAGTPAGISSGVVELALPSPDSPLGSITLADSAVVQPDPVLAHYLHIAAMAVDNAGLLERCKDALAAREEILAVVSHDLRTPLNAIALGAHVLSRVALNEAERTAKLAQMLEAVRHAARLIDDLLEAAQLDAGHMTLDCQACSAWSVMGEAVDLLRPAAEARGIAVSLSIPDGFPQLKADPLRVRQVIQNVLDNALRVSRDQVCISIEQVGNDARVAISDNGPGIEAEALPRLFERFWRGQSKVRGSVGLGLSIARGIVEAHGGRIWAENDAAGGATIYFMLPLASATG